MDTKEEIVSDLEYLMRDGLEDSRILTKKGIRTAKRILHKALSLIQRGEKFEYMWKKFYKEWGEYPIELHSIDEFMNDIEQKYFPKEE